MAAVGGVYTYKSILEMPGAKSATTRQDIVFIFLVFPHIGNVVGIWI
jgi:hypothetical protein